MYLFSKIRSPGGAYHRGMGSLDHLLEYLIPKLVSQVLHYFITYSL